MATRSDTITINIGPQHPSVHGGIHVEAELSGETLVKATCNLGFDHRGMEYLAERRTYLQFLPYTSRLDYLGSQLSTWGYCLAVEKLAGIAVPERAEYLRVIFGELSRIASHLLYFSSICIDLGATTGLIYGLRDRERIWDMFEMTSGSRMVTTYMRFGGVAEDPPDEFWPAVNSFLDDLPRMLDEYNNLVTGNEMFQCRVKGIGVLAGESAISMGITGPNLRACGIDYDLRKIEPYSIYDRFSFKAPVRTGGDSLDRYLLRLDEIEQSARIIRQAVRDIPSGDIRSKVGQTIKPPAGSAYGHIEASKGELSFFLVSDGTDKPARVHIHAPSFINLRALEEIAIGHRVQELVVILASLDPVLGESDR